jgi:hypothetical protein
MRSKAGWDSAGYLIEDKGGNAKGDAERITFGAIALRQQNGQLQFMPSGLLGNVRAGPLRARSVELCGRSFGVASWHDQNLRAFPLALPDGWHHGRVGG